MSKPALSRLTFIKTVAKATAAFILAGTAKWLPETQAAWATPTLAAHGIELIALEAHDPRLTALRNLPQLQTAEFVNAINWHKAYLRRQPDQPAQEGIAVAFTQRPGETAIRFLVAQVVNNTLQTPIVVSTTIKPPLSPKGPSGTTVVSGLDGRILAQFTFAEGRGVTHTEVGKAPGLGRAAAMPLTNCRQPDTDYCVVLAYGICAPLIFPDLVAYIACVALGVAYCMSQFCN